MRNYFEGWYFKHQKDKNTIAFIPGRTNHSAFIQIITSGRSFHISYPLLEYERNKVIRVGNSIFSENGIKINIEDKNIRMFGKIKYTELTPIQYDVMGIFKYLPMECRHGIVSMHHILEGSMSLNGEMINFTNGTGYIEKDSGTSFPKKYLWVQCNDFSEKCSIMASIAGIPLMGFNFKGCICIIHYKNKEYRLATYLGVKIAYYNDKKIILKQGRLRLEIVILKNDGKKLYAPQKGDMTRTIHECASCKAQFKFLINNEVIFKMVSNHASFECV